MCSILLYFYSVKKHRTEPDGNGGEHLETTGNMKTLTFKSFTFVFLGSEGFIQNVDIQNYTPLLPDAKYEE